MIHAGTEFLQRLYPAGPWAVTVIALDGKIETVTFYPGQETELDQWISSNDGIVNIYYSINPVRRAVTKKPDREAIKEVAYLHVDIDPRPGADLLDEQRRILFLLDAPPGDIPPPTVILFSGGGYQALWKLKTPIPIDGDLALAEDAKLYNLQLEQLLGGDSCHDISRILRVPSWNVPNERKRKKGRTKVRAEVVRFTDDAYELSLFVKATPVKIGPAATPGLVSISGNIAPQNVNALSLDEKTKLLILEGPTTEYASRSEALFAVVCTLVREGLSDDVIYSIITDKANKISESILEKGSGAERYALRQLSRAKERKEHPVLEQLNTEYAFIEDVGGRARIVREYSDDATGAMAHSLLMVDAFRTSKNNTKVKLGEREDGTPLEKPAGDWWMKHKMRRSYKTVGFHPNRENPTVYNLWRGFAVEARPVEGKSDSFLAHVRENICNGSAEHYEYLVSWMARAVQHPDELGETAVVLRGEEGVGKTFFVDAFGRLFGRHYMKVSQPSHLAGNFNSHMQDAVVLFADEGFYAGDKRHASVLKDLVTGKTLTIERKGVDVVSAPNYLHILMASNSEWVVPAGPMARRYFVLDVSLDRRCDTRYFRKIHVDLEEGGYSDLLYTLLRRDLAGFEVRNVPYTAALSEQQKFSMLPEPAWWYQCLVSGQIVKERAWPAHLTMRELYDSYYEFAVRERYAAPKTSVALGICLKKLCPGLEPYRTKTSRGYRVPALAECRAAWNERTTSKESWDDVAVEPELEEQPRGPF